MEGKGKEMAKALPQEGKILLEKLSLHAHGFGGWGRGVVVLAFCFQAWVSPLPVAFWP